MRARASLPLTSRDTPLQTEIKAMSHAVDEHGPKCFILNVFCYSTAMFEAPSYACPTHCAKGSDALNRASLIANDSVDASVLLQPNRLGLHLHCSLHQPTEVIQIVLYRSHLGFHQQLLSTILHFEHIL